MEVTAASRGNMPLSQHSWKMEYAFLPIIKLFLEGCKQAEFLRLPQQTCILSLGPVVGGRGCYYLGTRLFR